jgi:hypothetical protein
MLNGILRETPKELLHEIILYDDFSEEEHIIEDRLREYGKLKGWNLDGTFKFFKAEERQGLIRAKVTISSGHYISLLFTSIYLYMLNMSKFL